MLQGVRRSATDKQSPPHWRLYSLIIAPSRSDGAPYNIPISKAPGGCEGSAASGVSAPKSHRSPDYCPIRQFTIAPLPKETQRPRCVCHAQNCREMFHLLHPYYTISRGTSAAPYGDAASSRVTPRLRRTSAALPGGASLRDGQAILALAATQPLCKLLTRRRNRNKVRPNIIR